MAAILVVSDRGDILSPKNAPPTIAPTVIPRFAPNTVAIPTITIPTVPTDPQEVPVIVEKIIGTMNAKK